MSELTLVVYIQLVLSICKWVTMTTRSININCSNSLIWHYNSNITSNHSKILQLHIIKIINTNLYVSTHNTLILITNSKYLVHW